MAVVNWSLQAYTDTAANLNARATPILEGQLAIETDTITTTPKFKIGDGVSLYSALPYFYGGASSAQNLQNVLSIGSATGGLGYNITLTTGDVLYIGNNTRSIYTPALGTTGITLDNTNSSEYIILKDAGGVDFSGTTVTMAQLGYLNGVTSSIQTQLNNKQPLDVDLTSWAGVTRAAGFDTFATTPSSANLASLVTDETGSGSLVFGTQPTFTQWITVPRIYGGTSATDGVDIFSTSGVGTGSATAVTFRGGNNGATILLTMLNDGTIRIPNNRVIQGTDSVGTNRSLITWSAGDNITIAGRPGTTDIVLNPTSGGVGMYVKSNGDVGIGNASPTGRLNVVKTTEQLRVGYDTSNYFSTTVSSVGDTTMNLVGTGSKLLNITANTSIGLRITNNSVITAYLGSDGSGAYFGSLTAHDVYLYRGNSLKLTITSSSFLFADSYNLQFNTTNGTKIGTATTQKLAFWSATPIVQPTTSVTAATFVANTSGIANDTATFDGYTIGQVVKALRNCGLLA